MDDRLQLIECQREAEQWLAGQRAQPLWDEEARNQLKQLARWRAERVRELENAAEIDAAKEWNEERERIILEQDVVSGLIKGLLDGLAKAVRGQSPE